jgi:hypothetical protein
LRREPKILFYPDFRLWQAFLIMHLLYSVTYSVNYDQAILLAVVVSVLSDSPSAVSLAMTRTRVPGTAAVPRPWVPALPGRARGISAQAS